MDIEAARNSQGVRRRRSLGVLLVLALASGFAPQTAAETIDLVPEQRASWRLANLFSWLRPSHNFSERSLHVETTPPDATLDLFYIRANFQKRYEQTQAPALIRLPRRMDAGPRDAVTVRAFREGYRQREISIRVSSKQDRIHIDLEPLPNLLLAASHTYLGGRTSLAFLTREALTVRVQDVDQGFNVILADTATGPEVSDSLDGIRSPWIRSVESHQLGEDLLVRVHTTRPPKQAGLELRSRQGRDEPRDLYVYSVDMVPADAGADAVRRARAALAAMGPGDVTGCATVFDQTLRTSLDPAALSRALAPRGAFTDPYLRAAMKRLGEISPDHRIAMLDGSRFDPSRPIELAAALSQPAEAEGYLALLRTLSRDLEDDAYEDEALRSLLAPEMGPSQFDAALARASEAERLCRAG